MPKRPTSCPFPKLMCITHQDKPLTKPYKIDSNNLKMIIVNLQYTKQFIPDTGPIANPQPPSKTAYDAARLSLIHDQITPTHTPQRDGGVRSVHFFLLPAMARILYSMLQPPTRPRAACTRSVFNRNTLITTSLQKPR